MTLSRSQILLGLACIVTLFLTWQTYQADVEQGTVLPTRVLSEVKDDAVLATNEYVDLALPNRASVPLTADLFARQYVKPKPKPFFKKRTSKPAPKNVVPPPPPLPFKYVGLWKDNSQQAVMLDYRGELLVVKQGDVVANRYKVEAINESAGRIQIKFLLMSLDKIQTLQARVGQP